MSTEFPTSNPCYKWSPSDRKGLNAPSISEIMAIFEKSPIWALNFNSWNSISKRFQKIKLVSNLSLESKNQPRKQKPNHGQKVIVVVCVNADTENAVVLELVRWRVRYQNEANRPITQPRPQSSRRCSSIDATPRRAMRSIRWIQECRVTCRHS